MNTRTLSGPGSERPYRVVGEGIPEDLQVVKPEGTSKLISSQASIDASRNTSLIMIASRDRDTRVYPQPTYFTIRLPKTFKNVKTVTITQLNLLNSFFNFSTTKGNTTMYINELGRTITLPSGETIPNDIKVQIRNGTYTAQELVTELSNSLNQTPLFADIQGGLGGFIQDFQGTGDYSVLFNQPGSIVYNSLTAQYDSNVSMSQLVARYFQTVQTSGTVNYSYTECEVAYYYPMIKEMTARNIPFNTYESQVPAGFTRSYDYILFGFQGLNDPYIQLLISDPANVAAFETFRFENTFNTFLVNQYTCRYNSLQGRLQISATALNPSIQNDLTLQYNTILNDEVIDNGFSTVAAFQSQYNSLVQQNGALLEYYNFIHRNFTNQFGINFGTYSAEFFANLNNEVTLFNTTNKRGWFTTLTPEVSLNAVSKSEFIASQVSTPLTNIVFDRSVDTQSTFLTTYNLGTISFPNASETTFGYTDISFSVVPTSYTRVLFKSPCRQTINLMTIPRYITERSPGTEETYLLGQQPNETPFLFDVDNGPPSTVLIRTDVQNAVDFNMYTIQQVMLDDKPYMRAENRWITYMQTQILAGVRIQEGNPNYQAIPPLGDITLLAYRPHIFFELRADQYALFPTNKWNMDICVETQTGVPFAVPIRISHYRDRAGFMMDVQDVLAQNYVPNPRHVFETQVFQDISNATLTIETLSNEIGYITVSIASSVVLPSAIPLRVYAVLHDPYGVHVPSNPLDSRKMPWKDLPPLVDQFTPDSSVYRAPQKSIYDRSIFRLGYDVSGVSNNFLDYYIHGSDGVYYDPTNVGEYESAERTGLRYLFSYKSPAAPLPLPDSEAEWYLYFSESSQNIIYDTYETGIGNQYLNSSIGANSIVLPQNESLLVNWFDPTNTTNTYEYYTPPAPYGLSSVGVSMSISTGIFLTCRNPDLVLQSDMVPEPVVDISGFSGIGFFLNPNDIVKLDSIQLKFAYIQPSLDENGDRFTRDNGPVGNADATNFDFHNQASPTQFSSTNAIDVWDDWYVYNRRNVRIGVFRTADISGMNSATLSLGSALATLTLTRVSQIGQYTKTTGTFRTREPDWGTYYTYTPLAEEDDVWDINNYSWRTLTLDPDTAPTYTTGDTSYPGYFLTHTNIYNYTFKPRSYGIAPSVGHSIEYPRSGPSYTADIANSYTIVPFYNDAVDNQWKVGSFFGVCYTHNPVIPEPDKTGDTAPYYGPTGIFAWNVGSASTFQLANLSTATNTMQPYYFNAKIDYETIDVDYDPATDLSAFGGFAGISNELQDTVMFLYNNTSTDQDLQDLIAYLPPASTIAWKWGQESNTAYTAWDDQNGYNYLSYIFNTTVRSSITTDTNYAVHVRGYVPTSKFNTGLRIIGKNVTDFGVASLYEIGQEITDLSGYTYISNTMAYDYLTNDPTGYSTIIHNNDLARSTVQNNYSHQYADALAQFNDAFTYPGGIIFGKKIGYRGVTFTLNGYVDCMNQYVVYYSTIRGGLTLYSEILSTTTGKLNAYVKDRYANILPPGILNRTRITDPIPFSLLLNSKLESPYNTQFDEWGLGWNLGFKKADTPYLVTQVSDTFIRITQDYIYLRLNPEMNMNTLGASTKEDLSLTHDTFAESNKYFAKILLNNFGGFCRAAVQMPKDFTPVLGKYDTLSLQLVDRNGNQIDNTDCDYDIVMEITEIVDGSRNKFAVPQGQ
jgi:hypothetical protein